MLQVITLLFKAMSWVFSSGGWRDAILLWILSNKKSFFYSSMVCIIWFSSIAGVILTFLLNLERIRRYKDRSVKDEDKLRRKLIRRSVHRVKFSNPSAIKILQRSSCDTNQKTCENDCCAICLGDFHRGEQVCFSKNKACSHVFHDSCAEEWLMRHSECPCCRASYILDKDVERESKFSSFMTTCACWILSQLIFRIEILWVAIVSVLYVQQFASGREYFVWQKKETMMQKKGRSMYELLLLLLYCIWDCNFIMNYKILYYYIEILWWLNEYIFELRQWNASFLSGR